MTRRLLGKPPTLRYITAEVRGYNRGFDGPGEVGITRLGGKIVYHDGTPYAYGALCGYESLPGDDQKHDCVAVARRLLAAWRDAQ